MRSIRKRSLLILGLTIIVFLLIIGFMNKPKITEEVLYREYVVVKDDITASLDGGGSLEYECNPYVSEIDGIIDEVLVEVGDTVSEGQILVTYDQQVLKDKLSDLNNAYQKAKRAYEDAINNKEKLIIEHTKINLNSLDSKNTYENSKNSLENEISANKDKEKSLNNNLNQLYEKIEAVKNSSNGSVESDEMKALNQQLSDLEKQLAELLQQKKNSTSTIDSLLNEKQQLENRLNEIEAGLIDLQNDALADTSDSELTTTNENNALNIDALLSEKETIIQTINSIDDQLNDLSNTNDIQQQIDALNEKIAATQKQIENLNSKEQQLETLNQQVNETKNALNLVKETISQKKDSLKQLNDNYEKQKEMAQ